MIINNAHDMEATLAIMKMKMARRVLIDDDNVDGTDIMLIIMKLNENAHN